MRLGRLHAVSDPTTISREGKPVNEVVGLDYATQAPESGACVCHTGHQSQPMMRRSWARRLRVFLRAASIFRLRLALGFS